MHIERNKITFSVLVRLLFEARFSTVWLETQRGKWNSSDALFLNLLETLKDHYEDKNVLGYHFQSQYISHADFEKSYAWVSMMELGFSPDEITQALSPFILEK